jgi:hypothetical protein
MDSFAKFALFILGVTILVILLCFGGMVITSCSYIPRLKEIISKDEPELRKIAADDMREIAEDVEVNENKINEKGN